MEPAGLKLHIGSVLLRLKDVNDNVFCQAVSTLGKLSPSTLAAHKVAIVKCAESMTSPVRERAFVILHKSLLYSIDRSTSLSLH